MNYRILLSSIKNRKLASSSMDRLIPIPRITDMEFNKFLQVLTDHALISSIKKIGNLLGVASSPTNLDWTRMIWNLKGSPLIKELYKYSGAPTCSHSVHIEAKVRYFVRSLAL